MKNFAVIIPTIQRDTLEQALESVYSQEYNRWKIYLVNDSGYPLRDIKTPQIFANRINILETGKRSNDSGTNARNLALIMANEKFITYIDDDDVWLPAHLDFIVGLISFNKEWICTSGGQLKKKRLHRLSKIKEERVVHINTTDIMTPGICHPNLKKPMWTNIMPHDRELWNNHSVDKIKFKFDEVTFHYRYENN